MKLACLFLIVALPVLACDCPVDCTCAQPVEQCFTTPDGVEICYLETIACECKKRRHKKTPKPVVAPQQPAPAPCFVAPCPQG